MSQYQEELEKEANEAAAAAARELEEEKWRQSYRLQCNPSNIEHPLPPPPVQGLIGEYCSYPLSKQLTESDLRSCMARLLLVQSDVKKYLYPLLSSDEVEEIKNNGIELNVYDGEGNVYEMIFKCWRGIKLHVVAGRSWVRFCHDHNLGVQSWNITLWMFKHVDTHQLCFAILPNWEPNFN